MSGFFGWIGAAAPTPSADRALRADQFGEAIRLGQHRASHCAIATDSDEVLLYQDADGCVLVAGRPRWRDAGLPHGLKDFARQCLDRYRQEGTDVLQSIAGSFALALALESGRKGLIAVDRMGVFSVHYRAVDGAVLFGSSADLVRNLSETTDIDTQSLFNYISFHIVPGPTTIYRGQLRIEPGGFVSVSDGRVAADRYWRPDYDEGASQDLDALAGEFRRLLERSVSELADGERTGTFLSGGTDSSTVAGILTRMRQRPARTYSIGFRAEGYDEMGYARIAARHFGTEHHEYYVTPEDVGALAPRLAAFCDQPFGNASAVPTYYCAHLAKSDGVDLMLGGDGGDELFGGNERYATQAIYDWYARVPRFVREGLLEPVANRIPGEFPVALVRKGASYVRQAATPLPQRLHIYNMLNREPLTELFTRGFLEKIDPSVPMSRLTGIYEGARARGSLNRMLALDLEFTLADNDLYKVSRTCELAGVRVAYPMLDDDLVAFSLHLPARLKLRGTRLRYFFKQALRDFLPDEIIRKRKHGFGLPIGIWMRSHQPLRELAYDSIRAFGRRGIIRPEFAERMIAEHESADAVYWGSEIWSLTQLELWLQAHGYALGRSLT